jgi:hypothetical protein
VAGPSVIAACALLLAAAPLSDQAVRAEVDRLTAAVSAARALPYRGTLPARALSREAMRAAVTATVTAGAADPAVVREAEILRRLGVMSATADYATLLVHSYAAAGGAVPSYDVSTGRLLVPDFVPLVEQRLPLAHEIAHAIADQRFGLRRLLQLTPDGRRRLDGDAQRARAALIEGDATLAALETIDPRETFLGPSALGALESRMRASSPPGLPRWLTELSRFVHVDGLLFTARVRARQPWRAVDALWADPPASTEQVLHPESYDDCDNPIPVAEALFPQLPGFGRPAGSDVLGELAIRTWLATAVPPEIASRAAAGWGGDRAALYPALPAPDGGAPPEPPLLWLTIWDNPAEATDFAQAATTALAKRAHATPPDSPTDRVVFSTPPGISTGLVHRGEAVALLFDVPDDALGPAERIAEEAVSRPRGAEAGKPRGGRPRHAAPAGCPRRDRAAAPR